MFTAQHIMKTHVVTVRPDTPIEQAVERFEEFRVSGIPVVDEHHQLIGVITEYDILRCMSTCEMSGTVADWMNSEVISINANALLDEILELFLHHNIRRVPVVENGRILGIISRRDLVSMGNIRQQILELLPG